MDGSILGEAEPTTLLGAGLTRVLEVLEATLGTISPVLLRDTTAEFAKSPIIDARPSQEMPSPGLRAAGRIEIYGEIARGGMGAILKGRDLDLGRELVVKVLLKQHQENPDLVRRFIEEAQIAGQLQHPGIAPVYEMGLYPDGRPFFSMKLVKGRNLAEILVGQLRPVQDFARFLGVFEAICQTMAYAHSRGVIHRDLKPSNIMVGAFGEVQVMDWGLAKVLPRGGVVVEDVAVAATAKSADGTVISTGHEGVNLTQAGSIKGTPAYMAPEQARGETDQIDERADVFAMGSILCVILTGEPAFTGRNTGEIQRKAALGDLADALKRLDQCEASPELLLLVRDCLAREPQDRPRHAGIVLERMTAYLAGVQEQLRAAELASVEAQARAEEEAKRRILADKLTVEAQARANEEGRRRRATLALAASVLALITLGAASATWFNQQRAARLTRFDGLLAQTETAVRTAEQAEDSRASVEWQSARVVLGQTTEVGASGLDRARADRLTKLRDRVDRVFKLGQLRDRLELIRADRGEHQDEDRTDREFVAAFREFGFDLDGLDTRTCGEALAGSPFSIEIAAALDHWSNHIRPILEAKQIEANSGKAPDADLNSLSHHQFRLREVARLADPDPFRGQLRMLRSNIMKERSKDRAKSVGEMQQKFAEAVKPLIEDEKTIASLPPASLILLGSIETVAGLKPKALLLYRRAVRANPGDFWLNISTAMSDLDPPRNRHERPDEAIRYLTVALALRPRSAAVHNNLGTVLMDMDRLDDALIEFREALTIQPNYVYARFNLGLLYTNQKKYELAAFELREVLKIDPDFSIARTLRGQVLGLLGRYDEAYAQFDEVTRRQPKSSRNAAYKSEILTRQNRYDEAITEARKAVRLDQNEAHTHHRLAHALASQGVVDEVIQQINKAIQLEPSNPHFRLDLGIWLRDMGDKPASLAALDEAIKINPKMEQAHGERGWTLYQLGRWNESIAASRRALEINQDMPWVLNNLVHATLKNGKFEDVEPEYRRAIVRPDHSARILLDYGGWLREVGRFVDARTIFQQMTREFPKDPVGFASKGNIERRMGLLNDAIESAQAAIQLDPTYTWGHQTLAWAYLGKEDWDHAILEYLAAIKLSPDDPVTHHELGMAYHRKLDLDRAIPEFLRAIQLKGDEASYHCDLGWALNDRRDYEAALKSNRRALQLDDRLNEARLNEGNSLRGLGKIDEAIASYTLAISRDSRFLVAYQNLVTLLKEHNRHAEVAATIQKAIDAGLDASLFKNELPQARRFERVHNHFDAFLNGAETPADARESLVMGEICHHKKLSAAGVPFFVRAFEADPELAANPRTYDRYNAACAALVAGTGGSKDDPPPDEPAKARLRAQALAWLVDDLNAWGKVLETNFDSDRALVLESLAAWRKDPELAGIRDAAEVAKLPLDEQKTWRGFWDRIDQVQKQAEQARR